MSTPKLAQTTPEVPLCICRCGRWHKRRYLTTGDDEDETCAACEREESDYESVD